MEDSVAPLLLLLLCPVSPVTPVTPVPPCFTVPPDAPTNLNLTSHSHGCTELDWDLFQRQSHVWLSHNGIEALSPSSRAEPGLQELDLSHNSLRELPVAFLSHARGLRRLQLQHNHLQELPHGFFANATALQSLQLEGNPLTAVPPTAFQHSLRLLTLPCRCDAVGSVLAPCSCSHRNCTAPQCRCFTSHHDSINVTEFHARQCRGSVGLVAGLAGAAAGAVVLLAAGAVVWYRRRKAAAAAAGEEWGKWEPTAAHGQPRYISRAAEIGTNSDLPDYENIFVNPHTAPGTARGWAPGWQEEPYSPPSPQAPSDDDYFLETVTVAGEQPIYANTQSHNDIYIIPDQ
ncbi:leucine-rich repeat-containing protein 25 [Colius striatus]|uniref:leucine-rich repeat-containing protein 25 n=1 Tax=Colius striatus TaxID=57412 RepID=UPI002B1DFEB9|nr:leucine-rich repeat-containing protein 25 [Colius striatus]